MLLPQPLLLLLLLLILILLMLILLLLMLLLLVLLVLLLLLLPLLLLPLLPLLLPMTCPLRRNRPASWVGTWHPRLWIWQTSRLFPWAISNQITALRILSLSMTIIIAGWLSKPSKHMHSSPTFIMGSRSVAADLLGGGTLVVVVAAVVAESGAIMGHLVVVVAAVVVVALECEEADSLLTAAVLAC